MGARECSLAARVLFALTAITTAAGAAFDPVACDKTYAFDVREWVVDYLRPTAPPRFPARDPGAPCTVRGAPDLRGARPVNMAEHD